MWGSVYRYFILHQELTIPGIGTFTIEQTGARSDFANKLIHPSLPVIRFNHEQHPADRKFYKYISQENAIPEVEAIKRFHDIAYDLQSAVNTNGSVKLQGIGMLTKEFPSTYSFQPEWNASELYKPVAAERAIRKYAEHTLVVGDEEVSSNQMQKKLIAKGKKDNWWVYALILGVIGVIVIVCYYLFLDRINAFLQ